MPGGGGSWVFKVEGPKKEGGWVIECDKVRASNVPGRVWKFGSRELNMFVGALNDAIDFCMLTPSDLPTRLVERFGRVRWHLSHEAHATFAIGVVMPRLRGSVAGTEVDLSKVESGFDGLSCDAFDEEELVTRLTHGAAEVISAEGQ